MRYLTPQVKYRGVSLIEVMFVLVIASSIILLGLQTYNQLSRQQEVTRVKYNIDALFVALKNYYLANCGANRSYTTGVIIDSTTGKLDPTVTTPPAVSTLVNITNDLLTPGYLSKWPIFNSYLVTSYVAQFNKYQNNRVMNFCTGSNCSLPPAASSKTYLWTEQVAIQVGSARAATYLALFNATCISSIDSVTPNTVTPCSASPIANDYIVFERLPSLATSKPESPYWVSMPVMVQFKRQYTNDEDYAVTTDDTNYISGSYQNFLCGG